MSVRMRAYLRAPLPVKSAMAWAEAALRDRMRRGRRYRAYMAEMNLEAMMRDGDRDAQRRLLRETLRYAREHVPAYRGVKGDELGDFPVLEKECLRARYEAYLSDNLKRRGCARGATSGSTGVPLRYLIDPDRVAYNYACCDQHLRLLGTAFGEKKIRMSGVPVMRPGAEKPPFGLYIRPYNQMQFSSYHIGPATAPEYLREMDAFSRGEAYGTGYASAWYELARLCDEDGLTAPRLRVLRLDSEGLTEAQQRLVERVFGCPVCQTYGLSEIGQFAFMCPWGRYHLIPGFVYAETLPAENVCDPGEIALTTLRGNGTPLIRYRTGDLGVLGATPCPCGMNTQYLTALEGRIDDYVLLGGRRVYRLSHLLKTERGVQAGQIVQTGADRLLIRVIPDASFDAAVLDAIRDLARPYVGDAVLDFELAQELEKTAAGKTRVVIRRLTEEEGNDKKI